MKGWRYEGYRHSLAARGIKTNFLSKRTKYKVPPAWKNVKFHSDKEYVVTGEDKKGRTQYIYPEKFREKADEAKYERVEELEKQMPSIIAEVKQDVRAGVPEAEAVYTIYKTGFRPGTEKDTQADTQAYGVSTLEPKHVKVKGDLVQFKFIGKKGVPVEKAVRDKALADIMRKRKATNDGQLFSESDHQMRDYFSDVTDGEYKLKDLRTLRAHKLAKGLDGDKKEIAQAVSKDLGNTPAVAIKSYVDPELISND